MLKIRALIFEIIAEHMNFITANICVDLDTGNEINAKMLCCGAGFIQSIGCIVIGKRQDTQTDCVRLLQ
jgi:hypothetical protein